MNPIVVPIDDVDCAVSTWFSPQETVADLFALVDLIPDRRLNECRAAGLSDDDLRWWCWCEMKKYARTWPGERVGDRVRLRLGA